jgi:catechol 2,3-dioxygenase-like lactoylglutathione lyase family enzyme
MKRHTIYCIVFLFAASRLAAQAARTADTPVLAAHGYLAFSVPDMNASLRWYTEKLGMRVLFNFPRTETVHAAAAFLQGRDFFVELVQVDSASELSRFLPPREISQGGGRQFVFGLFKGGVVVDNLDAAVAALRARGVEIVDGPRPTKRDQPANVTIQDNSGNRIALLEGSFKPFSTP